MDDLDLLLTQEQVELVDLKRESRAVRAMHRRRARKRLPQADRDG